jgi:hypothetical protein
LIFHSDAIIRSGVQQSISTIKCSLSNSHPMATLLLRKYFARTSIIAMATPDVGETARGPICICAVKSFPSAGSESFRRELEEFENFRRLRAPTVAGVALGSSDIDLNSNDEVVSTNYGFDLPCEFAVIGCDMRFKPEEFESWISHSISHFCGASLPLRASCTFCHEELSSMNNLETSWRERMIHIGAHFENGCKNMPPDHLVIDYMRENGLITDEQYRIATKNTERGTEGLEDGRLIYIHDINPCQMQAMKVGPVSWGVSSGCGWHSRNVENRSLTKRRAGLILAVFPLLAGFLMGASYLWLNKSMGLAEPSAPMNLVTNPISSLEGAKSVLTNLDHGLRNSRNSGGDQSVLRRDGITFGRSPLRSFHPRHCSTYWEWFCLGHQQKSNTTSQDYRFDSYCIEPRRGNAHRCYG